MNKTYVIFGLLIVLGLGAYVIAERNNTTLIPDPTTTVVETPEELMTVPVEVIPVTHATAILKWGDATIYTDPTSTSTLFAEYPADIILVTDIHGDHLSTSTLGAIIGEATLVVPQAVKDLLPEALATRAHVLKNDEVVSLKGFEIRGIPMYNVPESPESRHVKGRGNGYVIERDGYRVYIAGDTGGTPEMRSLTDIDMAFIPMNLPYTMSVEEAADAVLAFKPKQVYPYHYRTPTGPSDTNRFKELVGAGNADIEVVLLNWYP